MPNFSFLLSSHFEMKRNTKFSKKLDKCCVFSKIIENFFPTKSAKELKVKNYLFQAVIEAFFH